MSLHFYFWEGLCAIYLKKYITSLAHQSILFSGKSKVGIPWWHHKMETFSALLALCAGNSPVTGEFPAHRPVTRIFDVFFDLRPKKLLSKQSWGWWFETPSRSLWRHCNASCSWQRLLCPNMRQRQVNYLMQSITRYTLAMAARKIITLWIICKCSRLQNR